PGGPYRRLHLLLPDRRRRLRHPVAGRRQDHHARQRHRHAVRRRLQLAARLGDVVRDPVRRRDRGGADALRAVALAAAMTPLARGMWGAIAALFVLFLLSPLALVILFSFTDRAMMNFPLEGLSLQWWQGTIDNAKFWPAFFNSLIIGGAVGAVSGIV